MSALCAGRVTQRMQRSRPEHDCRLFPAGASLCPGFIRSGKTVIHDGAEPGD
ncbi:hypothetical protein [Akkermansia sp.]|uniref:hypothetical protein n=1 Tax=Akkermansia sp. TaxID=1872421 RepID=UPI0025C47E31|nr:hypothetical protein [Akkermansia sp.]